MRTEGKLICTICPLGCQLSWKKKGTGFEIEGNKCPRGKSFGLTELTNPQRILTTTVKVEGGVHPLLPVRSTGAIPKEQLSSAMRELGRITVKAPVEFGQVVLSNWNGVDFIATRSLPKASSRD